MNYTFSPHRATLRWSPTFNRFVLPFVLSFLSVLPLTAAGALYAQEAAADAEAEEDTTVDPTEAFLNSFDPSKSFSKLLLPNVAERVGLTKDQTAEVNRLMAERATKLGQASRDQWPDIVRENEAALKAVLTPAQLSLFDVTRTEQKIVLRFSKERWADVLKWIAGELGMQLVMDAPPPGTFTYVDKTEYSPKEALDILCGVLQLKGYTLVRQNENLFLHDLKKGPIPLQLVPKITPLQLPAQSPNDIVQLTMPLGGRASSSALSVAKQFLGPYGSAEIAPSSGYLTVTDTVHALREILPAVLAIPVSTKPSSSPLWADYPLTNVEPAVVKEQIEHFLPTAKPLVNPASRTISFLALPSEQTIIAGIIHRLEAGGDPTREMTFAMYDLSDLTATSQQELAAYSNRLGQSVSSSFYQTRELELGQTIVDGFQKIAPSATITLNPISRQLIVFALPEDQQRIQEAVEQLRKPLTEEEKPQFALYRLQEKGKALSTAEITALKTLIPRGDMTFDAEKGTLLVVAPKEDQEKISQAVEGLNADYLSQDSQKSFVFYMMTGRQLSQFDSLFRAIAETPEMKGVIPVRDAATRRLSIWATKEQHARIQEIVDQITGQMGAANGEGEENAEGEDSIDGPVSAGRSGLYLETVKIEKGNLASYAQVLTSLFSGLEVNIDSVSRSIIVCGAREDVIAARQTIEKLTQGEDFSTKVIPFAGSVSPEALQAFQRSQPLVTIISDQKAKQLILIGPFQGVEQVSKGLEVVLNQEERGTSQTAKTYMPKFVEGSTLTKIVSELFPTLEVSSGENNRIIIRGAVEKVEDAIKTIEGVDIKEEGAVKRSFAAYSVRTMSSVDSSGNPYTPRNLVSDLQKLVPAAKVTYETYGQQIIVWGTEEEHEIIRQAIGNLNEKVTILDQFLRYQIRRADPTLLTSTLQQIYPRLKVQHDAPTNSILVQGNPTTLEEGKALLEMLDPEEPSPFDPTAAVYPFENEPSSAAVSTLRLLAPKARIEVNVLNRCLVVVARPAEHKIIEDAIQKLEGVLSTPEPVLAFYPYEASPTSATISALTRQFPLARITDMKDDKRLMVIAPPQVQKKVADALGLIAENTKPHDPVLKIYKFREKLDRAVTTTLQSFAPGAKLTLDTANRQLTVVAPQEDIDKIEAQLPMLVDSYADRDVKMIAYTAKGMALETLQSTLAGLHPSVTIKLDTAKKRLLIWGTAAEHAAIAEEIDTINAENDAGAYEGPKVVVYRMDSYRKTLQLSRVVKTMFPNAELIPDQQDQTLMIFATGEEHERIKEVIAQIDNPANENASVLDRFYRYEIKRAASSLLKTSIAQAYPQLNVSVDTASNSLLIQGNPSAIEGVKQFLEVLDPEQPTASEPTVAVYPLESEPSSAALATLRLMAPKARIEVNSLNRSLVVVARPSEHEVIEETIQKIGGAMAAPEPVLAFYPYQTPPTSATLTILSRQAPLARITDLREDKKLMVVAPPLVQEKVSETLGLIAENTTPHDPILKIYKFREKLDSTFTSTLQSFAPGAKLTLDAVNRQLTVVAQQDDIDKIEAQLPTLVDSYADRDRKMIAYTAKGMAVETLQSTIAGFHPTVTIKLDPAKKRLLIWGTAAEHAAIAEEIDRINAETDAGAYEGPKFVVYRMDNFRKSL
ncbi:MAG: hypothetical protein IJG83_04230, partial [Thermoguttaceae bacterium]|nr:hypothetical protein [Thermoguttaceae bacterium]